MADVIDIQEYTQIELREKIHDLDEAIKSLSKLRDSAIATNESLAIVIEQSKMLLFCYQMEFDIRVDEGGGV